LSGSATRISTTSQDHRLQLDALAGADCREVIVETASTRGERPKLRAMVNTLKAGDTLVIYKPDRSGPLDEGVARLPR